MTFDIVGFAREVVGVSTPAKLLELTRKAAAEASGRPVFAAHVLTGRRWDQATISSPAGAADTTAATMAVRSALYAIQRRLSLTPQTLQLARSAETEAIFKALWPEGQALDVFPLNNRGGQLTGSIVVGAVHGGVAAAATLRQLEAIATIAGPAMHASWQHALARRDQERLQLLSETTDESLWDMDIALGEIWWGGNLENILGGRVSMSRRPDWRLTRIHPDDAEQVISSLDQAMASQANSWNAEYLLLATNGPAIQVREHVYFLRDAAGRAYRAIGTIRDISALHGLLQREKQARAQAEEASLAKDQFLAMLGHELRNPLAPIVTVITLWERKASGPDKHLEILKRQTQHLVRLVDDLLDVSRISTGKVELTKIRTLIDPLVQRAAEMSQPIFEQRRHTLDIDVSADVAIDADTARMTQVLTNLLTNAAKYTEPGGHVQVVVRDEEGDAVIRIKDNGIGIAPDFLPVIFDMFSQSHQALDRAQGGLGLGLSIVKNIVKLHGGTVHAHSQGLGFGSEIVVRLPRAAQAVQATIEPATSLLPDTPPYSVLIVDDNEDAALMMGEWLSDRGGAVRIAHHPVNALEMFAVQIPDVVLLDIGLPTMDGYELAQRLRTSPGGSAPKLIAVTGYGLASDKDRAIKAGFNAHMAKPVSLERLSQLIDQLRDTAGFAQ